MNPHNLHPFVYSQRYYHLAGGRQRMHHDVTTIPYLVSLLVSFPIDLVSRSIPCLIEDDVQRRPTKPVPVWTVRHYRYVEVSQFSTNPYFQWKKSWLFSTQPLACVRPATTNRYEVSSSLVSNHRSEPRSFEWLNRSFVHLRCCRGKIRIYVSHYIQQEAGDSQDTPSEEPSVERIPDERWQSYITFGVHNVLDFHPTLLDFLKTLVGSSVDSQISIIRQSIAYVNQNYYNRSTADKSYGSLRIQIDFEPGSHTKLAVHFPFRYNAYSLT